METNEILKEGCQALGVAISDTQTEQFIKYMQLLLDFNTRVNLTAIKKPEEIITKHFLDCISFLPAIQNAGKETFIDVGTGAGFPGIPLKIMLPDCKMVLLDSLNKRVQFLETVKRELALQHIACIHSRAEELGQEIGYREQFSFAVSRAVAHLSVLCEYCLPFVQIGGTFLALKGPNVEIELEESKKAISLLGAEVKEIKRVQIPFTEIVHTVVLLEKKVETPHKYPRKSGKPIKNPI